MPSHFRPFVSNTFFWHLLLFKQKKRKKKIIDKKKTAEKGGSFPSSYRYALSLLAPPFAFSLLSFCFKRFFLTSFSSKVEKKKRKP